MRGFRIGASLAAAAAAVAALAMPGLGQDISRLNAPPPPTRVHRKQRVQATYGGGRSRNNSSKGGVHGQRECARRRRQIAKGSLTESNGLVR